jgi:1-acyl-sn-glycerol-3-phosphate acyltransferase
MTKKKRSVPAPATKRGATRPHKPRRRTKPAPVVEEVVAAPAAETKPSSIVPDSAPPSSDPPTEPLGAGSLDDEDDGEDTPDTEVAYIPRTRSSVPPGLPRDNTEVAEQIRALEARLDRLIDAASQHALPDSGDDDEDDASFDEHVPMTRPSAPPPSLRTIPPIDGEATVFDTARELLSTDFYLRKWGRLGMRNRSEEVDDFGFDPIYEQKVRPVFNFLYEKYFRCETEGIEKIPAKGRCLLVANHSGTLPYDGVMLKTAVKREHPHPRDVRWLAEDFIFHFPFLGSFTNRIGAVRACQENAERLLQQEQLVAVFPEGVKGIGKLYKERYRLQRFGRGGFIKLCLRTGTPIVPVAIIGAEEANPMLFRVEYLSRALGVPYIPVTPTFPWLGPAGLAPAPTKWKMLFGDLVDLSDYGPEAADDEILVGQLAERVRGTIQAMLDRAVGERRSVWFG